MVYRDHIFMASDLSNRMVSIEIIIITDRLVRKNLIIKFFNIF